MKRKAWTLWVKVQKSFVPYCTIQPDATRDGGKFLCQTIAESIWWGTGAIWKALPAGRKPRGAK